jgi:polar amino acid transport system substrate-binding protein
MPLHRSVLAILLLALTGCGGSSTQTARQDTLDRIVATKVLRVGMNPGYAPFEMIDTDGAMIGFDCDVARYVAGQMGNGVQVEFVKSDWDPIIANLNAGKFDMIMSGMTRTPQRALRCAFTNPYFTTGQTLLINSAKHPPGSVKSVADLDRPGMVVATRLGTTGEIAARKAFHRASIKTMDTEEDAALEVEAGRADVMVYDQPYVAITAKQSAGRCWAILTPFTHEELAIAVRRDDLELCNWLNVALDELRATGTWDSLYGKWFVEMPWLRAAGDTARAAGASAKPTP